MGRLRRSVTDEEIVESYSRTHSTQKTAKELGLGISTVHRSLVKSKVNLDGLDRWRKQAALFTGREMEIRKSYEAGATYDELRAEFGQGSDDAFRSAIKRAGGSMRLDGPWRIREGELERIKELRATGMGQMRISIEIGRSQPFVSRVLRENGIAPMRAAGESHPGWKGGKFTNKHGYVRAWVAPDDPMASMRGRDGYVQEHRLVLARKLGRPLTRTETVHHINGDKSDNRPENLQLRQGRHGKHVVIICRDCGSHNVGPAPLA